MTENMKCYMAKCNTHLKRFLKSMDDDYEVPDRLLEAVRYAALGPGKRLRPYLVVRCAELVGDPWEGYWFQAVAIECVHAFSLVHDDLPAMDDDDLRRGRPTCHKAFDEATAILAGDALLALAFELVVQGLMDTTRTGELVMELARGTGWSGMIGGQMADIQGSLVAPSRDLVESIHLRKTAHLFETACRIGTLAGGGTESQLERLGWYGRRLGLAFQIADDLLDVNASAQEMGKKVNKDAQAGKQTYPACVGIQESQNIAKELVVGAIEALSPFGPEADDLRQLANYAVDRNF